MIAAVVVVVIVVSDVVGDVVGVVVDEVVDDVVVVVVFVFLNPDACETCLLLLCPLGITFFVPHFAC